MSEPLKKELPDEKGDLESRIKIIQDHPPNIEKIAAVFPGARGTEVIFAYGDAIYNPFGHKLPNELIAHETVHCDRQREIGVDEWWDQYLVDGEFRYHEEYLAHLAELKSIMSKYNYQDHAISRVRENALDHIARKLSAPLYETKVPFHRARSDLRRGLKNG